MIVCALLVAAPSMASVWQFDRILARTDNRVLVRQWIASDVPEGSTILESGSQYGHSQLWRAKYRLWLWDKGRRAFFVRGQPAAGRPDWILLQESPLLSTTQPIVTEFLRSGYQYVRTFRAFDANASGNIYDIQDAFFVPYAGFHGIERAGPNFTVYRRADVGLAEPTLVGDRR